MPGYKRKKYYSKKGKSKKVYKKKRTGGKVASGFGEYRVNNNTLMANGSLLPVIKNTKSGIIVRHKEYFGDVYQSSSFQVQRVHVLNPGNRNMFPWLGRIATHWDQYEWRGMVIEYRTTSSPISNTASPAMGTVCMATEYDALDGRYDTKQEMMNSQFANSAVPSKSFLHAIECKRSQSSLTHLYTRDVDTPLPTGADRRFYDLGTFQVATAGMFTDAQIVVGELYVSYEVEFFKPQVPHGAEIQAQSRAQLSESLSNKEPYRIDINTPIPTNAYTGDFLSYFRTTNSEQMSQYAQDVMYKMTKTWTTNGDTVMQLPEKIQVGRTAAVEMVEFLYDYGVLVSNLFTPSVVLTEIREIDDIEATDFDDPLGALVTSYTRPRGVLLVNENTGAELPFPYNVIATDEESQPNARVYIKSFTWSCVFRLRRGQQQYLPGVNHTTPLIVLKIEPENPLTIWNATEQFPIYFEEKVETLPDKILIVPTMEVGITL